MRVHHAIADDTRELAGLGGDSSVTDKDRPRWPRFKTKEAAQEIAARCHAMERQTKVHWRAMNMEDGSWIVAAYYTLTGMISTSSINARAAGF
jgi:hypothetical protein